MGGILVERDQVEKELPEKEVRIYDTMAQIFAGYSECVAVVGIAGTESDVFFTYIAANEVTTGKSKNKQLIQKSVDLIIKFLANPSLDLEEKIREVVELRDTHQGKTKQITIPYSVGLQSPTSKEQVFSELINPMERQKLMLKQAASLYTSYFHTEAMRFAVSGKKSLELSFVQKKFGHNEGMGFYACGAAMALWEHLGKSVDFFQQDTLALERFGSMIWVYDKKTNVHAEMKILNQILEDLIAGKIKKDVEIYIGISKDCCFHCHHTLEAAQQILVAHGINITFSTRGAHDVSFGSTKKLPQPGWQYPSLLRKKDLSEYDDETQSIIVAIKHKAMELFMSEDSFVDAAMVTVEASSSDEEPDFAAQHRHYLRVCISSIFEIGPEDPHIKEKELLELGLMLLGKPAFVELFNNDIPMEAPTTKRIFDKLLKDLYGEAPTKEQAERLFKFLKNPHCAGSRIANCLTMLDTTVLKPYIGINIHQEVVMRHVEAMKEQQYKIQGLTYMRVPGDGHCLYNAVALYLEQDVTTLRNMVADELERNKEKYRHFFITSRRTLEEYISNVRSTNEWAGDLELSILINILDRPIVSIGLDGRIVNNQVLQQARGEPIFVHYDGVNHYDGLVLQSGYTIRGILDTYALI